MPPHVNPLDLLSARERGAVVALMRLQGWTEAGIATLDVPAGDDGALGAIVELTRAVLKGADAAVAAAPPEPRRPGPLNAADASALALDLGATTLTILATDPRRSHGVVWGRGVPSTTLTHDETAAALIAAVRAIEAVPASPAQPEEPQP